MNTPIAATNQATSPLLPKALVRLFFEPKLFFLNIRSLTRRPEVYVVAWLSGIAYAMDRIDSNIMKEDFGNARPGWQTLGPWLTESWLNYWGFVLAFGILNGWILWHFGGWWYRKRLEWSGAMDVDRIAVRATYMYQDLVHSGPAILVTLGQTIFYSTYAEVWSAEEYWSLLPLIFIFWSCVTSYVAASTYPVVVWKARLWFLILPIALYVVVLGVVGTLYALMQ